MSDTLTIFLIVVCCLVLNARINLLRDRVDKIEGKDKP